MQALVRFWLDLHEHNLPLYALVTVLSVALAGAAMGHLATGILTRLGAGRGPGKGEA